MTENNTNFVVYNDETLNGLSANNVKVQQNFILPFKDGIPPVTIFTDTGKLAFDNSSKLLLFCDGTSWVTLGNGTGSVTLVNTGTGLTGGPITISGTISLANTAVTAGTYTNATITVDAQGRLTNAANGTAPVTSITSGTGISITGSATSPVVNIADTAVTAGTYIYPSSVTVNAQGQLTAITSGGAPSGTVSQVNTGTGLTGGPITTTGTILIANTAVTPGSYTSANITVNAQGQLTAAASGSVITGLTSGLNISITGGATPSIATTTDVTFGTVTLNRITNSTGISAIQFSGSLTTNNATPTTLFTIATASNTGYGITFNVICTYANGGANESALFALSVRAKNSGGSVTIIDTYDTSFNADASLAAVSVAANASGTNILLRVTGLGATNLTWGGQYKSLALGYF